MEIKIKFLGAAQNVTGSRHLVEVNGSKILIDCGLYQERQFKDRNWQPFEVEPSSIDAVLLTHAHLDHCGLLPKLVKEGFSGKIYCTKATAEIATIIMLDSAKIQEEDAEHKRQRHEKQGKDTSKDVPLYKVEDAEKAAAMFSHANYREAMNITDGIEVTFYDAGHVLGSSIIRLKVHYDGQERIVLFSGDMGRPGRPIVCDPTVFDRADYVLIESTYGDRVHKETKEIKGEIEKEINAAQNAKGNVVIPSFALERSQEVLYYINESLREGRIKHKKIFLDSPMASKITTVFRHHPELFDMQMTERVNNHESPFDQVDLHLAGSVDESKEINNQKPPIIIIAGSGMCTGGRIKYHLINNITKPENTIMFVGYQAIGTLGRQIVDGMKEVRILGQMYEVKARVVRINGFSAHADKNELLAWLRGLKTKPRKLFVVHGEAESAKSFGEFIKGETGWDVEVPEYEREVVLD